MLAEAIKLIASLSNEAAGVGVTELGGRKILVESKGTYTEMERPPASRSHTASSAEGFSLLVKSLIDGTALVFVGESRVVALLDSETRDDFVVLHTKESRQISALTSLGVPQPQKTVIRILREELDGTVDPSLLAVVRRLDFSRKNDGRSTVLHGRESMGRSVESVVQSAEGEIPETVVFTMRAHDVVDLPADITFRAAVTLDVVEEKIAIRPIGLELDLALRELRTRIVDYFRDGFEVDESSVIVVAGIP